MCLHKAAKASGPHVRSYDTNKELNESELTLLATPSALLVVTGRFGRSTDGSCTLASMLLAFPVVKLMVDTAGWLPALAKDPAMICNPERA